MWNYENYNGAISKNATNTVKYGTGLLITNWQYVFLVSIINYSQHYYVVFSKA